MSIWDLSADGEVDKLKELLKKSKKDLNKCDRNYNNWTPLHYAARYDCYDAGKLLIDEGANLEIKDVNKETPLHIAARNRSKDVLVLLIESGCNKNARNKSFQDAKTVASENGNSDIKEYLDDPSKGMKKVENIYETNDTKGSKSGYNYGY